MSGRRFPRLPWWVRLQFFGAFAGVLAFLVEWTLAGAPGSIGLLVSASFVAALRFSIPRWLCRLRDRGLRSGGPTD